MCNFFRRIRIGGEPIRGRSLETWARTETIHLPADEELGFGGDNEITAQK